MPIASIKWDIGNLAINSQMKASTIVTKSKTNKNTKKIVKLDSRKKRNKRIIQKEW
jgi:hypothetical protein